MLTLVEINLTQLDFFRTCYLIHTFNTAMAQFQIQIYIYKSIFAKIILLVMK